MTATTADTRCIQPRARGLTSAWAVSLTPSTMCSATSPTVLDASVASALVAARSRESLRLHAISGVAAGSPSSTPAHSNLVGRVEIVPRRIKEPLIGSTNCGSVKGWRLEVRAAPHIAVLCDGNRRWARSAGYDDVSYGYRMGAAKIAEMLRWCQEAGIEMATVYLLSTENLQRDPGELTALIESLPTSSKRSARRSTAGACGRWETWS